MNNFIELKNISKNYHDRNKVIVLKNLNYKFKIGKTYSLVGPSGSGKSTLLNILSLIDRPSSGNIIINETDKMVGSSMPHANLSSRFPKGPSPDGGTSCIVRSKLI